MSGHGSSAYDLAHMGAGFADPVHGAQQTFRTLLDAMSRPGRLHALPDTVIAPLMSTSPDMSPPVGAGMAAALLTLLDAETPVRLAGSLAVDSVRTWIRFHTGARSASSGSSPIAACLACDATAALWEDLPLGSDEAPHDGATLLVEVDGLSLVEDSAGSEWVDEATLTLRGPGIESTRHLVVRGLPDAFWQWRVAMADDFPRGVDIVLIHGTRLAAIPRSSRIERRA